MMTYEQRQARAIRKAFEQRAHVLSLSGRPGFYLVRSAEDPTERYVLNVNDDGYIVCSCRSASFGKPCWHAAKLENRLIREHKNWKGV